MLVLGRGLKGSFWVGHPNTRPMVKMASNLLLGSQLVGLASRHLQFRMAPDNISTQTLGFYPDSSPPPKPQWWWLNPALQPWIEVASPPGVLESGGQGELLKASRWGRVQATDEMWLVSPGPAQSVGQTSFVKAGWADPKKPCWFLHDQSRPRSPLWTYVFPRGRQERPCQMSVLFPTDVPFLRDLMWEMTSQSWSSFARVSSGVQASLRETQGGQGKQTPV